MKKDGPERQAGAGRGSRPTTRKLNFSSRVRGTFRRGADRVLAADVAWSGAFVLVMLALLGSQRCGGSQGTFVAGDVAPADVIATRDAQVVDQALTEDQRQEARAAVSEVYVYDSARAGKLSREISALFEEGRRGLEAVALRGDSDAYHEIAPSWKGRIRPEVLEVLVRRRFDASIERELREALEQAMKGLVAGNRARLEREGTIVLMTLPGRRAETLDDISSIQDLGQARNALQRELKRRLELPPADVDTLLTFAASFLDANVYSDPEATQRRRDAEAAAVPPVLVRVERGDVLVAQGEEITEDALAQIEESQRGSRRLLGAREFLGLLLLVSLMAFFLYRYSLYHQRAFRKLQHLHALLVLMLLSMMVLSQALLWLVREIVDNLVAPFDQVRCYDYLVPLGAGAILIALLANGRIATVYSAFAAVLFGILHGGEFPLTVWAFLVQLSGVYAISTYRERAALLRAGFVVGGAAAVTVLAVETLANGLDPLAESLYGAGLAFIGGAVGVGLLISFSLPLLEGLFNVLTDIRLLELSNVNNPLLSQLAIKAPGSYNHSLVVGTLAEEGARAIGANSLFCRVCAFYHDIGKINHPEYFVENQREHNPHDRLAPSMSALIIASHVKDGIKMAREARLPEQIIDIIPQHHGTRLMTYFYERARQQADPALGSVKEEDFRYPGPKPQTREAAIFMIADGVEAAARTVDEPTPNRLREVIRKITNTIVLDGQLDSCDLTFADLERIQEAFLRLLTSMYHHRVDYPGFDFRRPAQGPKPVEDEPQEPRVARGN